MLKHESAIKLLEERGTWYMTDAEFMSRGAGWFSGTPEQIEEARILGMEYRAAAETLKRSG